MPGFQRTLRAALPAALLLSSLGAVPACTTQAACFADCSDTPGSSTGGTGSGEMAGSAGTISIGFGGANDNPNSGGSVSTGGRVFEDGGMACDKVDLDTDINNCGTCGNVCIFTGADAMCVAGECVMTECHDDRYDLDKNTDNGCEYACAPSADGVEVCNNVDDDCDGLVDNGFDLKSDPQNCGVCGNVCGLLHASSTCEASAEGAGCVVSACEPGWYDIDGVDANGCEYQCEKTGKDGVACDASDPTCGVERCDAFDNDCDGVINDGNEANGGPDGGQPCTDFCANGVCQGQCTAGVATCVGKDLVCVPGKGPSQEKCDGEDNDCDGQIDNGFDLTKDANNCGACGVSCVNGVPNAIGQCVDPAGAAPPACQILTCKQGYKDLDANAPGCEYKCPKFPTGAETCNGVDDDCDGVVDNAAAIASQKPSVAAFCNNGRALGTTPCAGTTVSCGSDGWICNYPANSDIELDAVTGKVRVVEALCDEKDGNCDGQKDEAFLNKNQACNIGQGVCARTGSYACKADHSGTECPATAVATDAKDELCNGLDDDCDGQVDERTPKAGSQCYNGGKHDCVGYTEPMIKVGSTWVYTYEASRPDATDADSGTNDVRSCSKPSVLPWTSVSQIDAAAACAAVPTSVAGTKMRLCSESEWQTACLAGGSASPSWSFSTSPATYDDLVCNDAATGRTTPWETTHNNGQSQRCRTSTQIWDMSGNVAEWTGSCITVLGKDYCRVRGGSFLTQGPATACDFSFVLDVPNFANFDLGFRCCSDAAP